jgi:hypothetical protein
MDSDLFYNVDDSRQAVTCSRAMGKIMTWWFKGLVIMIGCTAMGVAIILLGCLVTSFLTWDWTLPEQFNGFMRIGILSGFCTGLLWPLITNDGGIL